MSRIWMSRYSVLARNTSERDTEGLAVGNGHSTCQPRSSTGKVVITRRGDGDHAHDWQSHHERIREARAEATIVAARNGIRRNSRSLDDSGIARLHRYQRPGGIRVGVPIRHTRRSWLVRHDTKTPALMRRCRWHKCRFEELLLSSPCWPSLVRVARRNSLQAVARLVSTSLPITRRVFWSSQHIATTKHLPAGGLIEQVTAQGGAVHVVWITSGDGFPEGVETAEGISAVRHLSGVSRLWRPARAGGASAMASLGVGPASLKFLGFPDEGLCELASTYLSAKAGFQVALHRPHQPAGHRTGDPWRALPRHRPPSRARACDIDFSPTLVAAPHPEDEHPDHCSTHIFIKEALERGEGPRPPRPRILHYVIHYEQWPLGNRRGSEGDSTPPDSRLVRDDGQASR